MPKDKRISGPEHNGAPAQTQRSGLRGERRGSGSERYGACPDEGYIPASPVKRTLAWIGVVYAVILLALTTYIYFAGSALHDLGPLLAVPGLVGLGAVSLVSWRSTGKPGKGPAIAIAVLCWLLALLTLPIGVAGLMSNFSVTHYSAITGIITTGG